MFGIFSPDQKWFIFRRFPPFFSHVALAMLLEKGKN
jgi:hypothetical protein